LSRHIQSRIGIAISIQTATQKRQRFVNGIVTGIASFLRSLRDHIFVRTSVSGGVAALNHRLKSSVIDARYQGIAKIEYPLHPLFGRKGKVVRSVPYGLLTCLEIEIDQKIVNVPRWMVRADLCSRFTCGPEPLPDLEALRQILTLLDQQA